MILTLALAVLLGLETFWAFSLSSCGGYLKCPSSFAKVGDPLVFQALAGENQKLPRSPRFAQFLGVRDVQSILLADENGTEIIVPVENVIEVWNDLNIVEPPNGLMLSVSWKDVMKEAEAIVTAAEQRPVVEYISPRINTTHVVSCRKFGDFLCRKLNLSVSNEISFRMAAAIILNSETEIFKKMPQRRETQEYYEGVPVLKFTPGYQIRKTNIFRMKKLTNEINILRRKNDELQKLQKSAEIRTGKLRFEVNILREGEARLQAENNEMLKGLDALLHSWSSDTTSGASNVGLASTMLVLRDVIHVREQRDQLLSTMSAEDIELQLNKVDLRSHTAYCIDPPGKRKVILLVCCVYDVLYVIVFIYLILCLSYVVRYPMSGRRHQLRCKH